MVKAGDTLEIIDMAGEPQYCGRIGTVTRIDDMGQIHGTWGGLALQDGDYYIVIQKGEQA